jgi:hypothetical protein
MNIMWSRCDVTLCVHCLYCCPTTPLLGVVFVSFRHFLIQLLANLRVLFPNYLRRNGHTELLSNCFHYNTFRYWILFCWRFKHRAKILRWAEKRKVHSEHNRKYANISARINTDRCVMKYFSLFLICLNKIYDTWCRKCCEMAFIFST